MFSIAFGEPAFNEVRDSKRAGEVLRGGIEQNNNITFCWQRNKKPMAKLEESVETILIRVQVSQPQAHGVLIVDKIFENDNFCHSSQGPIGRLLRSRTST